MYNVLYSCSNHVLSRVWNRTQKIVGHPVETSTTDRVRVPTTNRVESNLKNPHKIPRSVMCSALKSVGEVS
jgi:hypothetical protein